MVTSSLRSIVGLAGTVLSLVSLQALAFDNTRNDNVGISTSRSQFINLTHN